VPPPITAAASATAATRATGPRALRGRPYAAAVSPGAYAGGGGYAPGVPWDRSGSENPPNDGPLPVLSLS
jgi:hypothetical protein